MDIAVTIVGGGVCGIALSLFLLEQNEINIEQNINLQYQISLYEQMSGIGKKFLVAGNGGLNLTHSEEIDLFYSRYSEPTFFKQLLKEFSPKDFQDWLRSQDIETFVGTSGRVFPKSAKASQVLRSWIAQLKSNTNVKLQLNCKLIEIIDNKTILIEKKILNDNEHLIQEKVISHFNVYCLGGSSWKVTGSDGKWTSLFSKHSINLIPFSPLNCGFEVSWSTLFKSKFEATPVKNIRLTIQQNNSEQSVVGEIMLTQYGIEGSAVYFFSKFIQQAISENNNATLSIDLKPNLSIAQICKKLEDHSICKNTLSNYLRKTLNFTKQQFNLLMELCIDKNIFKNVSLNHQEIAKEIKNLRITLISARPIDEAISTGGGIDLQEIDSSFMLKKLPNSFALGEMLNWDAPTGGYLIQGCFSNAYRVANSIKQISSEL